jgi:hypothetical protein
VLPCQDCAQGVAACIALPACGGITYNASVIVGIDKATGDPVYGEVILKDMVDPHVGFPGYVSVFLPHPGAQWRNFTVLPADAAVSPDGTTLTLTANSSAPGQVASFAAYAYTSWPVAPLANSAGFPGVPFLAAVERA